MRETLDIIKRVLKSKKIREINEIIPESFYEKSSLVLIVLLLFMIPHQVYIRYAYHKRGDMVGYFDIVGKIILFYTAVTMTIRLSAITKNKLKLYFQKNKQDALLIIFLLLATISTFLSEDVNTAYYGAWFRDCGLRSLFIFGSIYILGRNISKSLKTKKIVYFAFLIVCTIQNIPVLMYYMGYYGLETGAYLNINHSGYFMLICIMAGIALILTEQNLKIKIQVILLYAFNVWSLIINRSFGPFLAFIAGLLFVVILYTIKHKKIKWEFVVIVLIFVVECFCVNSKTGVISRNFHITASDTKVIVNGDKNIEQTGSGRMGLWMDTMKIICKHPLIGIGPDNLYSMQPHNEIMEFTAENGIPAGICYTVALFMICIKSVKRLKKNNDRQILEGGVVFAYLVSSLFGVVLYSTFPFYIFYLGMLCKYIEEK